MSRKGRGGSIPSRARGGCVASFVRHYSAPNEDASFEWVFLPGGSVTACRRVDPVLRGQGWKGSIPSPGHQAGIRLQAPGVSRSAVCGPRSAVCGPPSREPRTEHRPRPFLPLSFFRHYCSRLEAPRLYACSGGPRAVPVATLVIALAIAGGLVVGSILGFTGALDLFGESDTVAAAAALPITSALATRRRLACCTGVIGCSQPGVPRTQPGSGSAHRALRMPGCGSPPMTSIRTPTCCHFRCSRVLSWSKSRWKPRPRCRATPRPRRPCRAIPRRRGCGYHDDRRGDNHDGRRNHHHPCPTVGGAGVGVARSDLGVLCRFRRLQRCA